MSGLGNLLSDEGKKELMILIEEVGLKQEFAKGMSPQGIKIQYKNDKGVNSMVTLGDWEED